MRELGLRISKYFVFLLFLMVISISCDKIQESVIPKVSSFYIRINLITDNKFDSPGSSHLITGYGYGGVIVYCESPDSFFAYDAACTNEISKACSVGEPNAIGSIDVTCTCCESEFILIGGAPVVGPAVHPLRTYSAYRSGNLLIIEN